MTTFTFVYTSDGRKHVPDLTTWDRGWATTTCGVTAGALDCYRLAGVDLPQPHWCATCYATEVSL